MERFGPSLVLLDKLAAGGMAEVYRAKQLGHGGFEKVVAVKRILPQYAESDDFKEMFLQEASLSALLQHPNIVQTYSNGEVGGYLYLTMEYVDGKNLRQVLAKIDRQKKRVPIEFALFVIAEAAKGLHYAHEFVDERSGQSMNIVHRDMSPQNVMIGYDGTVRIVDFGIAKIAAQAESTRAGVLKGKFGYMSPEQARGMSIDRRTDLFALGIIIFELLTQRRLFASDDDMRTLRLVKECRVPRPSKYNPSIGPQLDHIVLKALAKDRADRYNNTYELYSDLQRLLQEMFPKFIAADFSNFVRQTFSEEIREEKQKREKMHREAPAILDDSRHEPKASESQQPVHQANATVVEAERPTQVSEGEDAGLQMPDVGASMASNDESEGFTQSQSLFGSAETPRLTELQLETSKIGSPKVSRELLPTSQETNPGIKYAGSQSVIVELESARRRSVRKTKKMSLRHSSKVRRMAYVSLILIGVIFYLSEEEKNVPQVASIKKETPPVAKTEGIVPSEPITPEPTPLTSSVPVAALEPPVAAEPTRSQASQPEEMLRQPSIIVEEPEAKASVAALPGYLSISAYPRADRVLIGGDLKRLPASETAMTTPIERLSLPPGDYEVVLQNTTYGVSWRGRVTIRSQKISTIQDVVLK